MTRASDCGLVEMANATAASPHALSVSGVHSAS